MQTHSTYGASLCRRQADSLAYDAAEQLLTCEHHRYAAQRVVAAFVWQAKCFGTAIGPRHGLEDASSCLLS